MTAKPSRPPALVFDRAHLVADTIAMVLDDAGYAAHPAVTYREAKRVFHDLPELSLMVIHADTPGERRGSMLLQAALRERPATAMVVVSSRMPEDLEPFPRTAVFLEKPFDRAQLLDAIERARSSRPASREPS
jgi:FixJ family two-component response regulator